jgi:predicted Fe-Mo cluster-binding NifX family protein
MGPDYLVAKNETARNRRMSPPRKIVIPLLGNEVCPRFDLAAEVRLVVMGRRRAEDQEKIIVLPRPSAEELCRLILAEKADTVICGGIEDEHYQYLVWKKIEVYDSVIGTSDEALAQLRKGCLRSEVVLFRSKPAT